MINPNETEASLVAAEKPARRWAKVGVPAALAVGVVAGAFFSPLGVASAEDAATTDDTSVTAESDSADRGKSDAKGDRSERKAERKAERTERKAERKAALAEVLGVSVEELEEARDQDKSLAEIAEENGVAQKTLVAAIVEKAQTRIDEAVADGKIDADKAAEKKEGLAEKVEERVDTKPSERPEKGHGRKGHHKGDKEGKKAE